jgi:hypothetical protein
MLTASGVDVIPGISGPAEDVLHACLKGSLAESGFFMPGCRGDGSYGRFGFSEFKHLRNEPRKTRVQEGVLEPEGEA